MEQPYVPISCSFYDYLEEAATIGNQNEIEYLLEDKVVVKQARLKTLVVKDKIEYAILDSGESIRLDRILTFNKKALSQHKC